MQQLIKSLPGRPGIYHFIDKNNNIIYIGKAKNLKKRVSQYFTKNYSDLKLINLVHSITDIKITVTETEFEALLLECRSIKHYQPKYNIIFRDDKSYPYLLLKKSKDILAFPQLCFYRGDKLDSQGEYFGPFADVKLVRAALVMLQQVFKLRQCDDYVFKQRTRPCLQYQIGRCTAPCVGYVDKENYAIQVKQMKDLIYSKNNIILNKFMGLMQHHSDNKNYEQAAAYRDKIKLIKLLQQQTKVKLNNHINLDCIGFAENAGLCCFYVVHVRNSEVNSTSQNIFQKADLIEPINYLDFISQFYSDMALSIKPDYIKLDKTNLNGELELLLQVLDLKIFDKKDPEKWLELAQKNANLAVKIAERAPKNLLRGFLQIKEQLNLPEISNKIDCFDVSHTQGNNPVASCIAVNSSGFIKNEYRRFLIKNNNTAPGDDYAALYEALFRHYERIKISNLELPDLLLIDGGRGQLNQAVKVMQELQINHQVKLLSIAKGEGRRPGLESIYIYNNQSNNIELIEWEPTSAGFLVLQLARDEAHRFALHTHRNRRAKQSVKSILLKIPGVGPAKLKAMYQYFGGYQEIKQATIEQLVMVPGISQKLAQEIFNFLNTDRDDNI